MSQDFSNLSLEELYPKIGSSVVSSIPELWEEIKVKAVIAEGDNGELTGKYKPKGVREYKYFQTSPEQYLLFNALREKMKNVKSETWSEAVFTITPDGKFDLKYNYPSAK